MTEPDDLNLVPEDTRGDQALELAATVTSLVPWLGGPVSAILSGHGFDRKIDRVKDALNGVVVDLREFKSDVSERYARTDEFEELLESALRKAADERNEERRSVYRRFIVNAIREPGGYDDQARVLRLLSELEPDHLRILVAMAVDPGQAVDAHGIGSPRTTLSQRVGHSMPRERLEAVVQDLNAQHLTKLQSLNTTMTARSAMDLRNAIAPLGRQVLEALR